MGFDNDAPLYLQQGEIIENGIIHEEIIKVIDRTPNIFWKLRLHPIQLMDGKYEHHSFGKKTLLSRLNCEWGSASKVTFLIL